MNTILTWKFHMTSATKTQASYTMTTQASRKYARLLALRKKEGAQQKFLELSWQNFTALAMEDRWTHTKCFDTTCCNRPRYGKGYGQTMGRMKTFLHVFMQNVSLQLIKKLLNVVVSADQEFLHKVEEEELDSPIIDYAKISLSTEIVSWGCTKITLDASSTSVGWSRTQTNTKLLEI